MADIAKWYRDVASRKTELDSKYPSGYLFVTSVENSAKGTTSGAVMEVSTKVAAKGLVDGTARESTEAEIAANKLRESALLEKTEEADFRITNKQNIVVLDATTGQRLQPAKLPDHLKKSVQDAGNNKQ